MLHSILYYNQVLDRLDYLIEPVAMQYDFWMWENGIIPIYNYGCWFIFSSIFAAVYLPRQEGVNKTAQVLFVIWLIFFGVLTIVG